MYESCGLSISTHHAADSDIIIVAYKSAKYGQLPVPAVSSHGLIYCIASVKLPKPKGKYITYRDFLNLEETAF